MDDNSSRFRVLGSGSKGNATFVETAGVRILIDAGLGIKQLRQAFEDIDVPMASLDAVLITHEHSDHIRSVGAVLDTALGARVVGTPGTLNALTSYELSRFCPLSCGDTFSLTSEVELSAIGVSHDTADPCMFRIDTPEFAFASATDLGVWTDETAEGLRDLDALVLEFNHDVNMLRRGPYPHFLKKRVEGRKGHLSNWQAARLLEQVVTADLKVVVLAHLSDKNNTPELALEAAGGVLRGTDVQVQAASQRSGSDVFSIAPCRNESLVGRQLPLL